VTVFVILAAMLVAGALLLVVPPMLGLGRRRRAHAARQRQADTALVVLREQLAELEAEHAAGTIAEAEYQRAREELEARALDEGRAAEDGADGRPAAGWAIGLVVAVPLVAAVVYLSIGEPDALDPRKVAGEPAHQITAEQMAGLVAQLADRLEKDPSDPTGWLMLVRSYAMLGDLRGAAQTWQRIGDKVPEDAGILADWADVLVGAQNGDFSGEPDRLIARALVLEPDNVKALALAGTAAFQRDDYAGASAHWERILAQVPPGEDAYGSIVASINEARRLGGLPLIGGPPPAVGTPPPVPQPAGESALKVSGTVRLAPELAASAQPDESVFVFVRPAEGGIPVAALRLRAGELPAEFGFNGAQLMTEGPLPARIVVAARLSRHGDATARPGDLEGVSAVVSPDDAGVEVVIDRVRE
jgi:cytochrome c-type biogenesis protein CcmH